MTRNERALLTVCAGVITLAMMLMTPLSLTLPPAVFEGPPLVEHTDTNPPEITPVEDEEPQPANWITRTILLVLGTTLIALLIARILRYVLHTWAQRQQWRTEPLRDTNSDPNDATLALATLTDHLVNAVTESQRIARTTADPNDAIIAAWEALEHAAARSGIERPDWQTTSEFTTDMLRLTPAPPAAVTILHDAFHRARFGHRDLTDTDSSNALAALDTIADHLRHTTAS